MQYEKKRFIGKTVLITGANGGLGRCLVQRFLDNGAMVICCLREPSQEFEDFLKSIVADQKFIKRIYFDLMDDSQVKAAANKLIKDKTNLDILINNAGVAFGATTEMTSIKDLRRIFEANFFSQIFLTTCLLRLLKKSHQARIVNIGSLSGLVGDRGTLAYGASKSAFMFATKVMANEFAEYNINVNSVAPGVVATGMSSAMERKSRDALIDASFLKTETEPEDVASAVLFLAGEESRMITGHVLRVDGGVKI